MGSCALGAGDRRSIPSPRRDPHRLTCRRFSGAIVRQILDSPARSSDRNLARRLSGCEPNAPIPLIEGDREHADDIATEIRNLDQIRKEENRLLKRERPDL